MRNAQKEGTEINPRLTRNRTIAAQVIHLEKKHRHLEKKQNDLEEKHLVLEQEQTRCISLTEKANHDFCRVQDDSLEAQAKATRALDDASTNRDEMKRIQSIQDQHESILHDQSFSSSLGKVGPVRIMQRRRRTFLADMAD